MAVFWHVLPSVPPETGTAAKVFFTRPACQLEQYCPCSTQAALDFKLVARSAGVCWLPSGLPCLDHVCMQGCFEFASSKQHPVAHSGTVLLMVGSSIPPAAGLSSSSALVVASALALLQLWGLEATPSEVADFTCK